MRTRKPAGERQAEIVTATLALADDPGPDRLTMEAVAQAVGISQPAVFRHFPTKQALWAAVAERLGRAMRERWHDAIERHPEPLGRVRAIALAQLGLVQATPAITAILFSRELHASNAGLREAFLGLIRELHGAILEAFEEAAAAGRLAHGVPAATAATLIVTLLPGLAVRWSLSDKSFALVEEGARLLDLQLAALARPVTAGEGAVS